MDNFSIYLTGVGGQGIGLISETILRASDHAGHQVKAVDTHGLAQRGGIVVSRVRIGETVHSPLIMNNEADLVIALERHEALRGINTALRDGGTAIYYDTVWQPLAVRLNQAEEVSNEVIQNECRKRVIRLINVVHENLKDARMQNMVLLGHIDKLQLIPEIATQHYHRAMEDLMSGKMLESNVHVFNEVRKAA
jgi:indolepyruvate ferredoxin oxidoreductase beta subunit